jgi:Icc-related predicted phosphoesterase
MKLLVFSDIHGRTEGFSSLADVAAEADAVVVNGDLTHFGGASDARAVIGELKRLHGKLFAVPGNCDNEEVASTISSEGIGIDGLSVRLAAAPGAKGEPEDPLLYGIGGALPGPVSTPNEYSEDELKGLLAAVPEPETAPLLLVCHQPPHKTVADRAMRVKHVGSRVLREWMEPHAPLLILTGHIHESHGYDWYGETCVVNPGAFKEGRYAEIELDARSRRVEVELKSL